MFGCYLHLFKKIWASVTVECFSNIPTSPSPVRYLLSMRTFPKLILTVLLLASASINGWGQTSKKYLYRIEDTATGEYGYVNAKGDTIIAIGKYDMCFTEKFYNFAIVIARGKGLVGIDRNENVLFSVFIVDNGPDYPSNGLFRIIQNGKIGYANLKGQIVIAPQFDCAYPFKNGKAQVGKGCQTKADGEHHYWTGGQWYTINKKGNAVETKDSG